jgi:hypothetical protein
MRCESASRSNFHPRNSPLHGLSPRRATSCVRRAAASLIASAYPCGCAHWPPNSTAYPFAREPRSTKAPSAAYSSMSTSSGGGAADELAVGGAGSAVGVAVGPGCTGVGAVDTAPFAPS